MIQDFLIAHQLPSEYGDMMSRYMSPLIEHLKQEHLTQGLPLIIGLNGAQGAGKSTLAEYLCWQFRLDKLEVAVASLDDFYYSKQKRLELSQSIHPLLKTRGVPGTHDYSALRTLLESVKERKADYLIPRFSKATDDCAPVEQWERVRKPVDILILEGWCLGATACLDDSLLAPVNFLEATYDSEGVWRRYVNQAIQCELQPLYNFIDYWFMLKAPSFECVYQWRMEQEEKLSQKVRDGESHGLMNPDEIEEFIQYFQRISEDILQSLPDQCDVVWELDEDRKIIAVRGKFAT